MRVVGEELGECEVVGFCQEAVGPGERLFIDGAISVFRPRDDGIWSYWTDVEIVRLNCDEPSLSAVRDLGVDDTSYSDLFLLRSRIQEDLAFPSGVLEIRSVAPLEQKLVMFF